MIAQFLLAFARSATAPITVPGVGCLVLQYELGAERGCRGGFHRQHVLISGPEINWQVASIGIACSGDGASLPHLHGKTAQQVDRRDDTGQRSAVHDEESVDRFTDHPVGGLGHCGTRLDR